MCGWSFSGGFLCLSGFAGLLSGEQRALDLVCYSLPWGLLLRGLRVTCDLWSFGSSEWLAWSVDVDV